MLRKFLRDAVLLLPFTVTSAYAMSQDYESVSESNTTTRQLHIPATCHCNECASALVADHYQFVRGRYNLLPGDGRETIGYQESYYQGGYCCSLLCLPFDIFGYISSCLPYCCSDSINPELNAWVYWHIIAENLIREPSTTRYVVDGGFYNRTYGGITTSTTWTYGRDCTFTKNKQIAVAVGMMNRHMCCLDTSKLKDLSRMIKLAPKIELRKLNMSDFRLSLNPDEDPSPRCTYICSDCLMVRANCLDNSTSLSGTYMLCCGECCD